MKRTVLGLGLMVGLMTLPVQTMAVPKVPYKSQQLALHEIAKGELFTFIDDTLLNRAIKNEHTHSVCEIDGQDGKTLTITYDNKNKTHTIGVEQDTITLNGRLEGVYGLSTDENNYDMHYLVKLTGDNGAEFVALKHTSEGLVSYYTGAADDTNALALAFEIQRILGLAPWELQPDM